MIPSKTFKIIIGELEKQYFIKYAILNTSKLTGIPQNRERIYIVGFKSKIECNKFNFDFPPVDKKPIEMFLENEENINEKYYYTPTSCASSVWKLLNEHVKKEGVIYQYRRVYVRENKNKECPTLTANMGTGGHNVPIILRNNRIRKLTPRECFNLQGFPETYELPQLADGKLYSLAGNAVSMPIVILIAKKILSINKN